MSYKIHIKQIDPPHNQHGDWWSYSVVHDLTKVVWFEGVRVGSKKNIEKYLKDTIKARKKSAGVVDLDTISIAHKDVPAGLL